MSRKKRARGSSPSRAAQGGDPLRSESAANGAGKSAPQKAGARALSARKTKNAPVARVAPRAAKPSTRRLASTGDAPPRPTAREPVAADDAQVLPAPIELADEIRALEERVDKMLDEASRRQLPSADAPTTPPARPPHEPPAARGEGAGGDGIGESVIETARELLSTDFYLRTWGRIGMRNRSEDVDDFGKDPAYERKIRPLFDFLFEKYFRVECEGIGVIPSEGRCLLVANHSGTLPFDGVMIQTAVKREHPAARDVRWLAEDFIFHFPFLGAFSNRVGAVRACQENAERLLRREALVAVFPEGVKGIGKLFGERYRLQRFGRGGYIKLCLRTRTPIVPVAVIGGEETQPLLARIELFSKVLGLPYIPITPTFPLLGPLGIVPAPTKWRIQFGDPISLDEYGPEAVADEVLVGRLSERVRATIQGMLDRGLSARQSVWFG